jgi:excisionase family DNA binding protein
MNKDILTIPQAADYCSLSRVTLWKYAKAGILRASLTPGGHFRLHRKDLESFMRAKGIYPLGTYQAKNSKILIVDDDPQIRKIFSRILYHHGYQTETASDGFEAGVKVVSFKPALVILDLFMPGMDGFEACGRLKNNPDTSNMKILAVTGYDTPENMKRIMDAGADSYLTKPLDAEKLIKNVDSLLKGSEGELTEKTMKNSRINY